MELCIKALALMHHIWLLKRELLSSCVYFFPLTTVASGIHINILTHPMKPCPAVTCHSIAASQVSRHHPLTSIRARLSLLASDIRPPDDTHQQLHSLVPCLSSPCHCMETEAFLNMQWEYPKKLQEQKRCHPCLGKNEGGQAGYKIYKKKVHKKKKRQLFILQREEELQPCKVMATREGSI